MTKKVEESEIRNAYSGKEFVFWGKTVGNVLFELKTCPAAQLFVLYEDGKKIHASHAIGAITKALNLRLEGKPIPLGFA